MSIIEVRRSHGMVRNIDELVLKIGDCFDAQSGGAEANW